MLFSAALVRLGAEYTIDLDLARLIATGGGAALNPAFSAFLDTLAKTHQGTDDVRSRFMAFRDRLAGPRSSLVGFDDLNRRFFREVDLPTWIATDVKADPAAFGFTR